jgi:hypothetical protein
MTLLTCDTFFSIKPIFFINKCFVSPASDSPCLSTILYDTILPPMEGKQKESASLQLEGYLHFGQKEEGKASIAFKKFYAKASADSGRLSFYKAPKNSKELAGADLLAISDVSEVDRDPKKLKDNQWPLKITTGNQNYICIAESQRDMKYWVEGLKGCKTHLQKLQEDLDPKVVRGLTSVQIAQLAAFKARVFELDLDDQQRAWADDACLLRYLKARVAKGSWHPEMSFDMISQTLNWRKEFKPDCITAEDVKENIDAGQIYLNGKDKKGNPIVVVKLNATPIDYDKYTRFVVYIMESALRSMDGDADQWVWIVDLKSYTRKNSPSRAVVKEALGIFYTHYPERLYKLFIVDAPRVFSIFWTMVSAFLEPETKQKIVFLQGNSGEGTKKTDTFLEFIDKSVLETDYGGDNPSKDRGAVVVDDEEVDESEIAAAAEASKE